MPLSQHLLLHGDAFALLPQLPLHAGNVDHASMADGVVSGIILLLLGLNLWKRNDKRLSRKLLVGSLSLFILKLSVFKFDELNSSADVVIALMLLFSVVLPSWKTLDRYRRRALLICFFGLFVGLPAYLFGVGSLLLPLIPRFGEGSVLGIMMVGAMALILGLTVLVVRVGRASRAAGPTDRKTSAETKL